jgi:hypothetical protein
VTTSYQNVDASYVAHVCPDDGCPLPKSNTTNIDLPPNSTTVFWSDPNIWEKKVLPEAGDNVLIRKGFNVILDVSPPRLNFLTIEGVLLFEDRGPLDLSANYIFIKGGKVQVCFSFFMKRSRK